MDQANVISENMHLSILAATAPLMLLAAADLRWLVEGNCEELFARGRCVANSIGRGRLTWYNKTLSANATGQSIDPADGCSPRNITGLVTLCMDRDNKRAHFILDETEDQRKHCMVASSREQVYLPCSGQDCAWMRYWMETDCTW